MLPLSLYPTCWLPFTISGYTLQCLILYWILLDSYLFQPIRKYHVELVIIRIPKFKLSTHHELIQ